MIPEDRVGESSEAHSSPILIAHLNPEGLFGLKIALYINIAKMWVFHSQDCESP